MERLNDSIPADYRIPRVKAAPLSSSYPGTHPNKDDVVAGGSRVHDPSSADIPVEDYTQHARFANDSVSDNVSIIKYNRCANA